MATAAEVIEQAGLGADEFHARSKIREVKTAELKVDRSYQRDISNSVVDDISDAWNEVAAELLLVSDRGAEGLYVINGQHRTMAARKLGLKTIWARVVDMSDLEDPGKVEADLRLKTNTKLVDRPPERFKAQLRAGNPESLAIEKVLRKFKTKINLVPDMKQGLNSVSTIEQIFRQDDSGSLLAETLQVVQNAYGQIDGTTAHANLLKAVSWFLSKHTMEANPERLSETLRMLGPSALIMRANMRRGSEGGSAWINLYAVLLDLYNDGLTKKNRLVFTKRGLSKPTGLQE